MRAPFLIPHPWRFVFGVWAIAWAIGFGKFLGAGYVSFPVFPNVLDIIGLVIMGAYFIREAWKR